MSILIVRIQNYIFKWLFTGKIYNMCKYEIINIDLTLEHGGVVHWTHKLGKNVTAHWVYIFQGCQFLTSPSLISCFR